MRTQVKLLVGNEKLALAKANRVAQWIGVKTQCPNLKTTMAEIEKRVSAELTWQSHDEHCRVVVTGVVSCENTMFPHV